jgi:hypothetical protein
MKHAFVFAAYVPNQAAHNLAMDYLRLARTTLPGCDIYVGINPSHYDSVFSQEAATRFRAKLAYAPPHCIIDSDASAYQAALKRLRDYGREYDRVWFGHNKGASTGNGNWGLTHATQLMGNPAVVEDVFQNQTVGTYALQAVIHPRPIVDVMGTYLGKRLEMDWLRVMYLYSFYVVRGEAVTQLLKLLPQKFFDEPLLSGGQLPDVFLPGANVTARYFFERDFYQAIWRLGWKPEAQEVVQLGGDNWAQCESSRPEFDRIVTEWWTANKGDAIQAANFSLERHRSLCLDVDEELSLTERAK